MKKQSKRVRMKSLGSGTYYKLTKKDSNWLCNEKNACDIKLRVQTKGWEFTKVEVQIIFQPNLSDDSVERIQPKSLEI